MLMNSNLIITNSNASSSFMDFIAFGLHSKILSVSVLVGSSEFVKIDFPACYFRSLYFASFRGAIGM
jgi:hypothetical protein